MVITLLFQYNCHNGMYKPKFNEFGADILLCKKILHATVNVHMML
jgi:hypothetical protein